MICTAADNRQFGVEIEKWVAEDPLQKASEENAAGLKRAARRPIAVPVRFVAKEPTIDLEDVAIDTADQKLLAWELRADAEADLNRVDSSRILAEAKAAKSAAAEAKRLAQPCHDLLAALERQEAPAGLARLISHEVQRAVREEAVQLQGSLRQQLCEEASAAANSRMQELRYALNDVSSDLHHEAFLNRPVIEAKMSLLSDGGKADVAARVASELLVENAAEVRLLQFGEELRNMAGDAAEEARAEMDDLLGAKLRDLREVLTHDADRLEPAWCEAIASDTDGVMPHRAEEAERRLEALLRRTAETLELEAKVRQESELCLKGLIQEVRSELRGMLSKVVCFLEMQQQYVSTAPEIAKVNGNSGVASFPADSFLRIIGDAVNSFSTISGREIPAAKIGRASW